MRKLIQKLSGVSFVALIALSSNAGQPQWPSLEGRVICGYQGWFRTPNDAASVGWRHYAGCRHGVLWPTTDYLPDVSEAPPQDRVQLPFAFKENGLAEVISSDNASTVNRHFAWMKQYGIDGVMVQRFPTDMYHGAPHNPSSFRASGDRVLRHCKEAALTYGRSYTLMYDLSGLNAQAAEIVMTDWQHLVASAILRDPQDDAWQYHNGKPLIALWGVGFNDRRLYDLAACERLVDFFKKEGYAVLLGVPFHWRTLQGDTVSETRLHDILRKADVVHSWSVGRFRYEQVRSFAEPVWRDDLAWCRKEGLTFMPVVYPGFSWKNLKRVTTSIPRHDGAFLWSQFETVKRLGASCVYVAMFDEIDEGTQIFKVNNHPPEGQGFSYQTYGTLPSDHYLWLTGQATWFFRSAAPFPPTPPKR
jgi:hypothetical protein